MTSKFKITMTEIQNDGRFEDSDFGFDHCLSFEICQLNIIT